MWRRRIGSNLSGGWRTGGFTAPLGSVPSRGCRVIGASRSGSADRSAQAGDGSIRVFLIFLRLGLTSFGGPVAHLSTFRTEFVDKRRWLDDRDFADLVALAQFLPGPASSQTGLGIGLLRSGFAGGLAAWTGVAGAAGALVAIFLPGMLALIGVMRFWGALRSKRAARAVMAGVNAAVVGLLGTALDAVWTGAVSRAADVVVAVTGFVLLVAWRAPPFLVMAAWGIAWVVLG